MGQSATALESTADRRANSPAPIDNASAPRCLGRRFAFGFAALLIGCLVAEFAAFAVYGLVEKRPFSYSRVQAQRDEVSIAGQASAGPGSGGGEATPEFLRSKSPHPYLGYVATPSFDAANAMANNGAPPTHFGFYDGNPILKRDANTVIIAIVGGSVAYGFGLPASNGARSGTEELQARLASSPRFAGKNIVSLRLALSGYKQPQQLLTIGYLLSLGAEFDMVINIDGFNEVALHPAENARTGTFAAYPRMWSFQTAGRRPVATRLSYYDECRRNLAQTFSRAGLRHSVVASLIWKLRDRQLAREAYDLQQSMLELGPASPDFAATGPSRTYASESEMMNDLVAIWKRSSLQLDRLCRANGISYYHALQPNQYVTGSKRLSPAERTDAYDPNHPYRHGAELGYPLLGAAGAELRQEGVSFIDLSRVFADVDETLYIDDCCHFNDKGYTIVADALATAILSNFEPR